MSKKHKEEDKSKEEQQDLGKQAEEVIAEELDELALLITEKEELSNKFLRLQADFDNYRKRMQKEKFEIVKYATEDILIDILDVLDNFDRAVDTSEQATDVDTIIHGIKLVQKQFHDSLNKRGLKPLETVGKPFDPNFHEAMAHEETDDVEADHIVEEFQKGYVLNDKVIRYAKVKVAKKAA